MDTEKLNAILERYPDPTGYIIAILHEVQSHYNYLPQEALVYVAKCIKVPITRLYSIATFYHFFSLEPKGRHQVQVCLGTACHVKGSEKLLHELERQLGVKEGETTDDMQFSLGAVRCIGACSLAPVVVVDHDTHAKIATKQVSALLKTYLQEVRNDGK